MHVDNGPVQARTEPLGHALTSAGRGGGLVCSDANPTSQLTPCEAFKFDCWPVEHHINANSRARVRDERSATSRHRPPRASTLLVAAEMQRAQGRGISSMRHLMHNTTICTSSRLQAGGSSAAAPCGACAVCPSADQQLQLQRGGLAAGPSALCTLTLSYISCHLHHL